MFVQYFHSVLRRDKLESSHDLIKNGTPTTTEKSLTVLLPNNDYQSLLRHILTLENSPDLNP